MHPRCGIAYAAAALAVLLLGAWVTVIPSMPTHRGTQLTAAQFADNYNRLARYHGVDTHTLRPDGTFFIPEPVNLTRLNAAAPDTDALQALTFTEKDGCLTGVSFEDTSLSADLSYAPGIRDTAALIVMAYAWPRGSLWDMQTDRAVFDRLASPAPAIWQEEVMGCTVTVTAHPPEDTPPGEIPLYRISFSIVSDP
jgi:hypothetical protein